MQRELEMLSQSAVLNDSKSNPARVTNGDASVGAGHSESNGVNSAANTGKTNVNGLPGNH